MSEIRDAYSYLTRIITTKFSDVATDKKDHEGIRSVTIKEPDREPVNYKVSCEEIIAQGERLIAELKDPNISQGLLTAIYAAHGKTDRDIPGGMSYNAPRFVAWEVETAKYHLGLPYNANP